MSAPAPHIPVLLDEVIHSLAITPGAEIVDGTFGAGGYSQAILAGGARVYAFDRDPDALKEGADLAGRSEGALRLYAACFSNMDDVLMADNISSVDGVVLDIGVSSMQLDRAERGFSFQKDGPLDMRMDTTRGQSAAEWLAVAEQKDIARVIKEYGEERFALQIAKAIVARREQGDSLTRTGELASLVAGVVRTREAGQDPATRTFQAIRIYINQELTDLEGGLRAAFHCLKPGGLLAVISFHSLEDRIVKQFMQGLSKVSVPRGLPLTEKQMPKPLAELLGRIKPSEEEVKENPRARSAILRVMRKIKSVPEGAIS